MFFNPSAPLLSNPSGIFHSTPLCPLPPPKITAQRTQVRTGRELRLPGTFKNLFSPKTHVEVMVLLQ